MNAGAGIIGFSRPKTCFFAFQAGAEKDVRYCGVY